MTDGDLEIWESGDVEICETSRFGDLEDLDHLEMRSGDLEIWRSGGSGNLEMWRIWKIWRFGDLEIWKS